LGDTKTDLEIEEASGKIADTSVTAPLFSVDHWSLLNGSIAMMFAKCCPHNSLSFLESTMETPMELSLEQRFSVRSFENQVQQMSQAQAQDFLVQLYQQMMMRENMYKHFLKHQWGLESGPVLPSPAP
jgi:Phycobilisome degradation protein nblA